MHNQDEKARLLANLNELLRQAALLAEAQHKLRGMILAAIDLLEREDSQQARAAVLSPSWKPRGLALASSDVPHLRR